MKIWKKVSCLFLSLVIILSFISCSTASNSKSDAKSDSKSTSSTVSTSDNSKYNKGGVFPINKNTVTLSIATADSVAIADWKDNAQTKLLEKKGNYNLNFQVFPSAEFNTKLNLMVSAGGNDLPDVILAKPGDSTVFSWAQAGAIVPLKKYYSNPDAAYNLTSAIKKSGVDILAMITSPDGEIYGLPYFNQSYNNEYPAKGWFYEPYLEKLGLKVPTTTQELYDVFKAIYNGDPNGNGTKDEICLSALANDYSWLKYLMSSFIYAGDDDYLVVNNGKLSPAYNTNEWKEGLAYIKSLYKAGFIPAESFTQNKTQFMAMQNNEQSPIALSVGYAVNDIDASRKHKDGYAGMLPMKDKSGKTTSVFDASVADVNYMISKNCKDVEAAFRLGDLLCSEELAIHMRWGQEGVDWDYVKNAKVEYVPQYEKSGFSPLFVSYDDNKFWASTNIQKTCWRMAGCQMRLYNVIWGEAAAKNNFNKFLENRSKGQMLYKDTGPKEYIPKLIFKKEELDQISEIRKSLNDYIIQSACKFIIGQMDLDKEWDSYLKQLNAIGMDKYVKTAQTVYDRMYKK